MFDVGACIAHNVGGGRQQLRTEQSIQSRESLFLGQVARSSQNLRNIPILPGEFIHPFILFFMVIPSSSTYHHGQRVVRQFLEEYAFCTEAQFCGRGALA